MYLYSIEYSHISGCGAKQSTSITEIFEFLEGLLNNEYVVQSSIKLYTEDR